MKETGSLNFYERMKIDEVIRDKHKAKEHKTTDITVDAKIIVESDSEFQDDQKKAEKLECKKI